MAWEEPLEQESDLIRRLAPYRAGVPRQEDENRRRLTPGEIARLEAQGNRAACWSCVLVADDFEPSRIHNNRFSGHVVLGRQSRQYTIDDAPEACGVFDSCLHDVWLEDDVVIRRVNTLAGYTVRSGAAVIGCGAVTHAEGAAFGIGETMRLGLESGGRDVRIAPELTVEQAARLAARRNDHALQSGYEDAMRDLVGALQTKLAVIDEDARLLHTPRVASTLVGPGAQVRGATLVAHSTLVSSAAEPVRIADGAVVEDSVLQWGSTVDSLAYVSRSLLCERSAVTRHGKVCTSLLGPHSEVAAGEVTASLVGPFVGLHHQSLLIATRWPEGRGNVAYGCNCGSNHSGRAPDQEFRAGEGLFLGLGTSLKFPADLSRAPYSIVAAGVALPPGKIAFPFSLLNACAGPAAVEVVPGWVLAKNTYLVPRNEEKFRSRDRTRRTRISHEVLRREIMEPVADARKRLSDAGGREWYSDCEIAGLGAAALSEDARRAGIEAYTFGLRLYALLALWRRLRDGGIETLGQMEAVLSSDLSPETHAGRTLREEFPEAAPRTLLARLAEVHTEYARRVERSKSRDDERGRAIVDDYEAAHPPAGEDPIVRALWEENRAVVHAVAVCLG